MPTVARAQTISREQKASFALSCYRLIWPLAHWLFSNFFSYEVKSKPDLTKLQGPLIIASTHASWFDPWLIGAAFPRDSKLYPIRYAASARHYYFPLFYPFEKAFGTFPIYKKVGLEKGLRYALAILTAGGTIGIFPEGRKYRGGRRRNPRRGVGFLALHTGVAVLPVKLEGHVNVSLGEFFGKKRKLVVKISKPLNFKIDKKASDGQYRQAAMKIMQAIYKL